MPFRNWPQEPYHLSRVLGPSKEETTCGPTRELSPQASTWPIGRPSAKWRPPRGRPRAWAARPAFGESLEYTCAVILRFGVGFGFMVGVSNVYVFVFLLKCVFVVFLLKCVFVCASAFVFGFLFVCVRMCTNDYWFHIYMSIQSYMYFHCDCYCDRYSSCCYPHGCNLPVRSIPMHSRWFIGKVLVILMVTVRFDTNLLSILLRCLPASQRDPSSNYWYYTKNAMIGGRGAQQQLAEMQGSERLPPPGCRV